MPYCQLGQKSTFNVKWISQEIINKEYIVDSPSNILINEFENFTFTCHYSAPSLGSSEGEQGISVNLGALKPPVSLGGIEYSTPASNGSGFLRSKVSYTDGDGNTNYILYDSRGLPDKYVVFNSGNGHTLSQLSLQSSGINSTVKIFEKNQEVIEETHLGKVKFTVACGEECPAGSHKCTHNKYPGYCCVPCQLTGDRLKNIANKVGR